MDQATFELLQNYAKEIGYGESSIPETPYGALSFLVQLIDSHRVLRKMSQKKKLKQNCTRILTRSAKLSMIWKWIPLG